MRAHERRFEKWLAGVVVALVAVVAAVPSVGADPTLPGPGSPVTIEANGRSFPRDAQGRALNMHGYNIKLAADRINTVTLSQLEGMRANGFDLLRLAIFWSDLEPTQGTWNEQYFADLAHVLDLAQTAGVKVVLDMHLVLPRGRRLRHARLDNPDRRSRLPPGRASMPGRREPARLAALL